MLMFTFLRVFDIHGFSTGSIWNTIAFVKPTYITFPTFRPGSSADISFHFKTYRSHGVFLENSDDQLRNFIRIELNSESEPSSFMLLRLSSTQWCIIMPYIPLSLSHP